LYLLRSYVRPAALTGFEDSLDARVDRLLQGAVDAGNGDVYDQFIDAIVRDAHFELEIEQTLHQSAAHHIIMHASGTSAKITQQLVDAHERLAQAQHRVALAQERFNQAEVWTNSRPRWARRQATPDTSEVPRKLAFAEQFAEQFAKRGHRPLPSAQGWSNEAPHGEVSAHGNHN
jgi:hypothetical protein